MSLPNPEALYVQLLQQITNAYPSQSSRESLLIIGVHSGGAWIAQRLHRDLQLVLPCGFLDSALYRDDFSSRGIKAAPKPPEMLVSVNQMQILLVDDVLYTGRTTRAIINHLFDYGRPARIELAVLLDRGGRELPIAPDFVGAVLNLKPEQSLVLEQQADGTFTLGMEE